MPITIIHFHVQIINQLSYFLFIGYSLKMKITSQPIQASIRLQRNISK